MNDNSKWYTLWITFKSEFHSKKKWIKKIKTFLPCIHWTFPHWQQSLTAWDSCSLCIPHMKELLSFKLALFPKWLRQIQGPSLFLQNFLKKKKKSLHAHERQAGFTTVYFSLSLADGDTRRGSKSEKNRRVSAELLSTLGQIWTKLSAETLCFVFSKPKLG